MKAAERAQRERSEAQKATRPATEEGGPYYKSRAELLQYYYLLLATTSYSPFNPPLTHT